jgi:competence protein ComEC
MILVALMFVFGAWNVQQLAQLPSLSWLVSASFVVIAILFNQVHPRFTSTSYPHQFFKSALLGAAAFLFGVVWASGFAYWRMSDALPHTWEQKTIAVVGVVASVPEATERGERFRFDVEEILTEGAIVPKHISLNQYRTNLYVDNKNAEEGTADFNQYKAGERWLLSARLKRPHGTVNPHGFDFESWALAENMRATGSIKTKAGVKKLADFVWRPSYMVVHLRVLV